MQYRSGLLMQNQSGVDMQGLNRLRCIAVLVTKTLDPPSQLSDTIFGFCNPLGDGETGIAVTDHVSILRIVMQRAGVQSVCVQAKKVL